MLDGIINFTLLTPVAKLPVFVPKKTKNEKNKKKCKTEKKRKKGM